MGSSFHWYYSQPPCFGCWGTFSGPLDCVQEYNRGGTEDSWVSFRLPAWKHNTTSHGNTALTSGPFSFAPCCVQRFCATAKVGLYGPGDQSAPTGPPILAGASWVVIPYVWGRDANICSCCLRNIHVEAVPSSDFPSFLRVSWIPFPFVFSCASLEGVKNHR